MSRSALALLLLLSGGAAAAQSIDWQVLLYPDPAPGVARTWCYGINDAGDMVGTAAGRAFLLSDGTYYNLHPDGAASSTAWGINARGDIVGDYVDSQQQEHGFILRKGNLTLLDLDNQAMTHPRAINARGDIAGGFMPTTASVQHGFVLTKDGTLEEIQKPGAIYTMVFGISDNGELAGEFKDAAGVHGFVRTPSGEFLTLDAPNAKSTSAWKVNSRGEVAGYYWSTGTPSISHGFIWREGVYENDDHPLAVHTMDHGLNNAGQTCGMMSFTPATSSPAWGGFAKVW